MNLEIANRLQQLRKERGLSQEQLAAELGISRQAVSKWERAESSPDTDNLICLAKLYGISLDELLSTEQTVEQIKEEQVSVDEDEDEKEDKAHSISIFLIIITYFILGVALNLWHPAWILFLFIPINSSLIEAIRHKNPNDFAYPVFMAAVYLFLGCVFNLWHPMWIIFVTIPLYYLICDAIKKK